MASVKPTPEIVAICFENRLASATKSRVSVVIASPIGILAPADRDVQWCLVFLVMSLEPKNEHAQSLEEETPDHTERIGFTKQNDITAAPDDCGDLQQSDHVDKAITRTVFAVRLSEPRRQNVVFGNAVQDAVGADDGGVDGSGKNQNTHHHDKDVKREPQQLRALRGASRVRRGGYRYRPTRCASGMIMPAIKVMTPVEKTAKTQTIVPAILRFFSFGVSISR